MRALRPSSTAEQKSGPPPVWLMRQAGRYQKEYREIRERVSFLELCRTPDLAAQVTVFAVRQLEVDAAIIFADILLILDELGLSLRFEENHGPIFDKPVRSLADVDALPEVPMHENLAYVGKAIEIAVKELGSTPVIGFAGAPFTVASYAIEGGSSRNFTRTKCFMYEEPVAFERLMTKLTDATIDYLKMQIACGASCVQLFDSWVGCLSPFDFDTFIAPHMKRLFDSVTPLSPSIYFGTTTAGLLKRMAATGPDIIGVDWRMDLDRAWSLIGHERGIQGNLDPVVLLSDRATIKSHASRVLEQAAGRPRHIFNLGHGILPQTPVDNARYLVEVVRELGSR